MEYLECRTVYRHRWGRYRPSRIPWTDCAWIISVRCDRCQTIRHWGFDVDGTRLRSRYDYPDKYRISADEMPDREEMILRIIWADREQPSQE